MRITTRVTRGRRWMRVYDCAGRSRLILAEHAVPYLVVFHLRNPEGGRRALSRNRKFAGLPCRAILAPRDAGPGECAVAQDDPVGSSGELSFGDVVADRSERRVRRDKRVIHLAAREFALLEALLERPGHVLWRSHSRRQDGDARHPPTNAMLIASSDVSTKRSECPSGHVSYKRFGAGYVIGPPKV